MSIDLWVGSVTTLAGAALGGVISFALSRQQINEARRQRVEESRRLREQSSRDRRFDCYSEFISRARSYRNAIRFLSGDEVGQLNSDRLDDLAAAADAVSSLVFLVVESSAMYDACRSVLHAIGKSQMYVHQSTARDLSNAAEVNDWMAESLREFQSASREELGVIGVERSRIIGDYAAKRDTGQNKSDVV